MSDTVISLDQVVVTGYPPYQGNKIDYTKMHVEQKPECPGGYKALRAVLNL